jgi:hypothetical protein
MNNEFKFKTPQANWLYKRLISIAEDLKERSSKRDSKLEDSINRLYAENSTIGRYQDMVGYAFEKSMTVELAIIESFASISSMLNERGDE